MVAIIILRTWLGAVMFLVGITAALISLGWGLHLPHTVVIAGRVFVFVCAIFFSVRILFGAPSKQ
ncbi:MAG TPA: hypothetical protein VFO34_16985 [Candidatus Acidoferrales bacterium]|nr:hypothetical protein [Candidatus Acidoferrales bacterium]